MECLLNKWNEWDDERDEMGMNGMKKKGMGNEEKERKRVTM